MMNQIEQKRRARDSEHFRAWYKTGERTPEPEYIWHAAMAQGRLASDAGLLVAETMEAWRVRAHEAEEALVKAKEDGALLDWICDSYADAGVNEAEMEREWNAYEKAYRTEADKRTSNRIAVRLAIRAAMATRR